MIVDLLYQGKPRKEIIQHFTKTYGLCESAVDKWIKAARPALSVRQQADEDIRAKVQAEKTEDVARKLGISREWALTRLKQVADLDVRKIFQEDGTMKKLSDLDEDTARAIASIEVIEVKTPDGKIGINRKVKGDPRITAIGEIGKLLGWTGTASVKGKLEEEDAKGNKKSYTVTLDLG